MTFVVRARYIKCKNKYIGHFVKYFFKKYITIIKYKKGTLTQHFFF